MKQQKTILNEIEKEISNYLSLGYKTTKSNILNKVKIEKGYLLAFCLAIGDGIEADNNENSPVQWNFLDNIEKLLRNLEGVSEVNRTARFRTVVTFVDGSRELHSTGIIEGIITADQKGSGGFGYDPVFLPRGSQSTFSEMTQMEKNKISHRAKALIKMKKLLEQSFKEENV